LDDDGDRRSIAEDGTDAEEGEVAPARQGAAATADQVVESARYPTLSGASRASPRGPAVPAPGSPTRDSGPRATSTACPTTSRSRETDQSAVRRTGGRDGRI
jgi:hypothetical protein